MVVAILTLGPLAHDGGLLEGVEGGRAGENPLEGEGDVVHDEGTLVSVLLRGLDVVLVGGDVVHAEGAHGGGGHGALDLGGTEGAYAIQRNEFVL